MVESLVVETVMVLVQHQKELQLQLIKKVELLVTFMVEPMS